jgi:hypothetical protein
MGLEYHNKMDSSNFSMKVIANNNRDNAGQLQSSNQDIHVAEPNHPYLFVILLALRHNSTSLNNVMLAVTVGGEINHPSQ